MKELYRGILCLFLIGGAGLSEALETIEEGRIAIARVALPAVIDRLSPQIDQLRRELSGLATKQGLNSAVADAGQRLWLAARQQVQEKKTYDDRGLYWNRLIATQLLRNYQFQFNLTEVEREQIIEEFELSSRGYGELIFTGLSDLKILITGFDPFHLDKRITQSNPSGVAVLSLSGRTVRSGGLRAEIQGVTIPVRYTDFDDGEIEALLRPFYRDDGVDMIVTVSMGRSGFDLERFPGRRRSSSSLGNLNEHTGGREADPQIPLLQGQPLVGPEFVEFSLPVLAMMKATGSFAVRDNARVTTLAGSFAAASLAQLTGHIAVRGSGGGYLSNEISYRSIRLRNQLDSDIATGHIHTPRISAFDPEILGRIVKQIENMLVQALTAL
jgi:pyrrolidone-carboxylate peptidase